MNVELNENELLLVTEAIREALAEIELCEDISQGVEDDLRQALQILETAF